jgi:hypothetical protein
VNFVVLVEFELADLDLPLYISGPIIGFLLALESFANGRVAFDSDDDSPTVSIFAFIDRCHSSNLG